MSNLHNLMAPSLDDFEILAREAFNRLPRSFREMCGNIVFKIEDFADEDVLDELDEDGSAFELTGLFYGRDVGEADSDNLPREPNMIFLYRVPIIAEWAETGVTLGDIVTHVLIHEIGHHFGLSDEDIERIEDDAAEAA